MVAQVRYSVVGRSRGRVAPCAVCIWHMETRSAGFLVEPQNQGRRFVSDLASKRLGRFVSGLPSKSLGRFSPVWPQNRWRQFLAVWPQNLLRRFSLVWPQNQWRWFSSLPSKLVAKVSPGLASKPAMGFLVEPQNQGGGGFPVYASKPTTLV
jgi:hypothetical protein